LRPVTGYLDRLELMKDLSAIAYPTLPLVGKGGARIFQVAQQPVEHSHPDLESKNRSRE